MCHYFKVICLSMAGIFLSCGLAYGKTHTVVTLCDQALGVDEVDFNLTGAFIAYTQILLQDGVLGNKQLSTLLTENETQKELSNPFKNSDISSAQNVHEQNFLSYLNHHQLDKKIYFQWVKKYLQQQEQNEHSRKSAEDQTTVAAIKVIIFHPVQGGHFKPSKSLQNPEVETKEVFIKDFEMMNMTVTQNMWAEMMGGLPTPITRLGPDLPITYISLWSTMDFANKLSIKHGYQPYYDFTKIKLVGNAAEGRLAPDKDSNVKEFLKSLENNPSANNGYRLPTVYEQEFVRSDRGRSTGVYFTNYDKKNIGTVAWYLDNSQEQLHPVGEKPPLIIDNYAFFDLFGNVIEWTHSTPIENRPYEILMRSGGTMISDHAGMQNDYEIDYTIGSADSYSEYYLGFRLVRTLDAKNFLKETSQ